VRGSWRLRLPLDQCTLMYPSVRLTSLTVNRRASQVRSPQECMSAKNASPCHFHGESVPTSAAVWKNRVTSSCVSRYGCGRTERAFHWSESTYALSSPLMRSQRPKSLMYDIQFRLESGWADALEETHPSTVDRSKFAEPCSVQ